jgi:hypothetical protein
MRLLTWLERVWPVLLLSVAALALLVTVLTYGVALHSPELNGLGNLRNLHAVLMAGGVLLALNGALLPWRAAHIAAQSVSAAAMVAGGVVVYTWIERTSVSGEHLFATHEVLGFCVLVILSLHWLAAVAIALCVRRSNVAWWTQQHRLGGLFVQVGGVAAAATGVTTFQQMLDLSTFPYVAHQLRYGLVYVGLNVFVLLLVLLAGFVIYARRQGDGMHADATTVSESSALLN